MTYVSFELIKGYYVISVKGHNNDSRVCAGISALIGALVSYLMTYHDGNYYYSQMDADVKIKAPKKAKKAVMMFILGIMGIEKGSKGSINIVDNT